MVELKAKEIEVISGGVVSFCCGQAIKHVNGHVTIGPLLGFFIDFGSAMLIGEYYNFRPWVQSTVTMSLVVTGLYL